MLSLTGVEIETGQSPHVVPTKPGFWWCSFCGSNAVREVYVEESDSPDDPYLAVLDNAGEPWGVFAREIQWIAPVPSAEAVQAAVEVMCKAAFVLEAYGDHAVTLRNAIAGLTGGEG